MIDSSNPYEIIPISFDMKAILKERYYNVGIDSKYLIKTCSQTKASRVKLSEVHSVDKGINPDIKPERQLLKSQNSAEKSKLGQGREGFRRKMKVLTQAQSQLQFKRGKSNKRTGNIKTKRRYTNSFGETKYW